MVNPHRYSNYDDILAFYKRKAKECPPGFRLKLQRKSFLAIQFNDPSTGKLTARSAHEPFTDEGIINAVDKCWQIREAFNRYDTDGEFWAWFNENIAGEKQFERTLKNYQEIFETIETAYFNGKNKNTGRKRSRDIDNDVKTFRDYYQTVFRRFPQLDSYPSLNTFKEVLQDIKPGTKQYRNFIFVLKKIAELSHESRPILNHLNSLDTTQTEFRELQSIDLETFLEWFRATRVKIANYPNSKHRQTGTAWLSVAALCVVYALRPSEVAAIKNLSTPFTIEDVTLPPILAPDNQERLLYIGDYTYFGGSIKTGQRLCLLMLRDEPLLNELLKDATLPQTPSKKCDRFLKNFINWLRNNDCPVTQTYAFRHLGNQLGEKYGIKQETRARSMGHSVSVNESIYKRRSNIRTSIDLLTNHTREPLDLELAKRALDAHGIDPSLPEVDTILSVIYQLRA